MISLIHSPVTLYRFGRPLESVTEIAIICPKSVDLDRLILQDATTFVVTTKLPLTTFNQQLWLTVQPVRSDPSKGNSVEGEITTTVQLHSVSDSNEALVGREAKHSRRVSCIESVSGTL